MLRQIAKGKNQGPKRQMRKDQAGSFSSGVQTALNQDGKRCLTTPKELRYKNYTKMPSFINQNGTATLARTLRQQGLQYSLIRSAHAKCELMSDLPRAPWQHQFREWIPRACDPTMSHLGIQTKGQGHKRRNSSGLNLSGCDLWQVTQPALNLSFLICKMRIVKLATP